MPPLTLPPALGAPLGNHPGTAMMAAHTAKR